MKFPRDVIQLENGCMIALRQDRNGRTNRKYKLSFANDYRKLWFEGECWGGHRLSYNLNVSPIPCKPGSRTNGHVLHHCDHKWCINPEHLYLGTAKQNAKDKSERNIDWRNRLIEVGKARRGKPHSEERRRKIGAAQVGRKHSEATLKKMSDTRKALWESDEYRSKVTEGCRESEYAKRGSK